MTFLLLASVLAATPPQGWATAVSSLVKVRPGRSLPARSEVSLHAARGECESFQIATTRPARAVRPSALTLTQGGHTLKAALYREAYQTLKLPSGPDGAAGDWPDALIPEVDAFVHEPRNAFPFDATAARPVVVDAELCVPASAAPGDYRGALTLSSADLPAQRFDVALRVDPFELPATSSLPNSFGLSLYSLAQGHKLDPASKDALALLDRYAQDLLQHRITAYGMSFAPPGVSHDATGALKVDFSGYDREMAPYFEGKVIGDGARFTSAGVIMDRKLTSEADRVAYLRAWSDHFAQKKWPAVLFYYAKDEPTPKDYPTVIREGLSVQRAGGLSTLVTSAFAPALAPQTDIDCPLLNCFFPAAGAATCRNPMTATALRRKIPAWAHVWWYQSCMSHGCDGPIQDPKLRAAFHGWASYMVDASVPTNRAMGSLAFANGIQGELYFDTVYAYHQASPWESVWAFGGNGDGTLFYPGTPDRIGGHTPVPVDSLRLAAIRDGLEDYEYLTLARSLGLTQLAEQSARALTPGGNDIVQDPAVWEAVRDRLASALSEAWSRKYPKSALVHH